jgi:molecular chaperone GrpE
MIQRDNLLPFIQHAPIHRLQSATSLRAATMFRQALSTSSRALRSTSRAYAQSPLSRSHFSPAPISSVRSQVPSSRWYSDQAETSAKKEGEDGKLAAEASDVVADATAEAELKKKLETKQKEALDWKVSHWHRSLAPWKQLTEESRTNTFDQLPISETSRNGRNET